MVTEDQKKDLHRVFSTEMPINKTIEYPVIISSDEAQRIDEVLENSFDYSPVKGVELICESPSFLSEWNPQLRQMTQRTYWRKGGEGAIAVINYVISKKSDEKVTSFILNPRDEEGLSMMIEDLDLPF